MLKVPLLRAAYLVFMIPPMSLLCGAKVVFDDCGPTVGIVGVPAAPTNVVGAVKNTGGDTVSFIVSATAHGVHEGTTNANTISELSLWTHGPVLGGHLTRPNRDPAS